MSVHFKLNLGQSGTHDVAGNFHADHLAQALRVKGLSMVLITNKQGTIVSCDSHAPLICAELVEKLNGDIRKDVCCFILHHNNHFSAIRFASDDLRTPLYIDSQRSWPIVLTGCVRAFVSFCV